MRFAYADPPYVGQAKRHYDSEEVGHALLLKQLGGYDGWALSASSPSLHAILPMCPPETRIAAWVKPFAAFKPNVNPAYAWEPVLFCGARVRDRWEPTIRDWVSANITLRKGLSGAKPEAFCLWLFALLGARPTEDTLDDLFPGTGVVGEMWETAAKIQTLRLEARGSEEPCLPEEE